MLVTPGVATKTQSLGPKTPCDGTPEGLGPVGLGAGPGISPREKGKDSIHLSASKFKTPASRVSSAKGGKTGGAHEAATAEVEFLTPPLRMVFTQVNNSTPPVSIPSHFVYTSSPP